jgi:hypothetical protein
MKQQKKLLQFIISSLQDRKKKCYLLCEYLLEHYVSGYTLQFEVVTCVDLMQASREYLAWQTITFTQLKCCICQQQLHCVYESIFARPLICN